MFTRQIRSSVVRSVLVTVAFALPLGLLPQPILAQGRSGAVYVLTNQSSGNSVQVYRRAPDGTLSLAGTFSTDGNGSGTGADPLGSQGSLVLGRGHRLLFAVNAGSNDLSVFAVEGLKLTLLDKAPSGGQMPVSVAVRGSLVYALNAGGAPNIKGFVLNPVTNHLAPLRGSRRALPGGSAAAPAEVSFSPDGDVLMVTEKGTNKIDTYTIDDDGFARHPQTFNSSGATPFGFTFVHGGFAVVSEAGPSALSSYEVDEDGDVELVTGSIADTQQAACWVVVTRDSRFAYAANSGSGSISSYAVSRDGLLSLLDPTAATTGTGSAPVDMALSNDSRFLYVRDGAKNLVDGFRVERDGSLTAVGSASGVPAGAQGIAAR